MDLSFNPSGNADSFGHHFIVGLSGLTLSDQDKKILSRLKPIGVLLLKRNFDHSAPYPKWLESLRNLLAQVKEHTERKEIIVTLDHEGGRVTRTPAPITQFPDAMTYAKRGAEVARAMAIELKSLGVNLSWAPCADIHSNDKNPVIGRRAFGTTAAEVTDRVVEFSKALLESKLLGCAKHFPGHGDTSQDSHFELPVVNISEKELRNRELVPFKALAEMDIPFTMTAHIKLPQVDQYYPATLSEKILGILRNEFGYKGIIIADDVEMQAVAKAFRDPDGIAQAFKAGCDMFIVSRHSDPSLDLPITLGEFIGKNISKNKLSEGALLTCFKRIKTMVETRLPASEVKELDGGVFKQHAELAKDIVP